MTNFNLLGAYTLPYGYSHSLSSARHPVTNPNSSALAISRHHCLRVASCCPQQAFALLFTWAHTLWTSISSCVSTIQPVHPYLSVTALPAGTEQPHHRIQSARVLRECCDCCACSGSASQSNSCPDSRAVSVVAWTPSTEHPAASLLQ